MAQPGFVVVTDRGGHLHNAVRLVGQMGISPTAVVATYGPDIDAIGQFPEFRQTRVYSVPYLFSWVGKIRYFNPFKFVIQLVIALFHALKLKPKIVVSLGATNVVLFCFWSKLLGARIYHVECMNQVYSKSITGMLLYPICEKVYVQWKDLLQEYGPKAEYAGWVL